MSAATGFHTRTLFSQAIARCPRHPWSMKIPAPVEQLNEADPCSTNLGRADIIGKSWPRPALRIGFEDFFGFARDVHHLRH